MTLSKYQVNGSRGSTSFGKEFSLVKVGFYSVL